MENTILGVYAVVEKDLTAEQLYSLEKGLENYVAGMNLKRDFCRIHTESGVPVSMYDSCEEAMFCFIRKHGSQESLTDANTAMFWRMKNAAS